MSETVKLIIEIPKVPKNDHERWVLAHGIPLDTVEEEDVSGMVKEGQILTSLDGLKKWSIKEAGHKIEF